MLVGELNGLIIMDEDKEQTERIGDGVPKEWDEQKQASR